jgi:hypothetical protein
MTIGMIFPCLDVVELGDGAPPVVHGLSHSHHLTLGLTTLKTSLTNVLCNAFAL